LQIGYKSSLAGVRLGLMSKIGCSNYNSQAYKLSSLELLSQYFFSVSFSLSVTIDFSPCAALELSFLTGLLPDSSVSSSRQQQHSSWLEFRV
jgi:hypothetical protein